MHTFAESLVLARELFKIVCMIDTGPATTVSNNERAICIQNVENATYTVMPWPIYKVSILV